MNQISETRKQITLEEIKNLAKLRKRLRSLSLAIFSHGKVNGLLTARFPKCCVSSKEIFIDESIQSMRRTSIKRSLELVSSKFQLVRNQQTEQNKAIDQQSITQNNKRQSSKQQNY